MPELPEVEVTVRELEAKLIGKMITKVVVNKSNFRKKVPDDLADKIKNKPVSSIYRRAKYILIGVGNGHLLLHLGESGSLRLFESNKSLGKHDHVEFHIEENSKLILRASLYKSCYVGYVEGDPYDHPPFAVHGPDPLGDSFTGRYLYEESQTRKTIAVKNFIMEPRVVAGMGNIYASEVLFDTNIHPEKQANHISESQYESLAKSIKKIISAAISTGGTTLGDEAWTSPTGFHGKFKNELNVYDKEGETCNRCKTNKISKIKMRDRSTYLCEKCQKL